MHRTLLIKQSFFFDCNTYICSPVEESGSQQDRKSGSQYKQISILLIAFEYGIKVLAEDC